MDNVEWHPFFYNGQETNIEVTRCGRVRRVPKDWIKCKRYKDVYEVDFYKFKRGKKMRYIYISSLIKGNNPKCNPVHQIIASVFLNHKLNSFHENNIVVDHIDSNKENNHVDNLRLITHRENNSKERTIKSGLPVGVAYNKGKYRVLMRIEGKNKWFGHYINIEKAAQVYKNALEDVNKFLQDTDNEGDIDEWFYSYRAKMKEPRHNIGKQLAIQFN
jgi:hypothetical protein